MLVHLELERKRQTHGSGGVRLIIDIMGLGKIAGEQRFSKVNPM